MAPGPASTRRGAQVPVRTILVAAGLVLATAALIEVILLLRRPLIWAGISLFLAVVLEPIVEMLVSRAHLRRTLAALVVFVLAAAALGGLVYLFVRPIYDQVNTFVNNFPSYVKEAEAGRGNIGRLIKHFDLQNWVRRNDPQLRNLLNTAEKPALHVAKGALTTAEAVASIVVLTFLMLIEGPRMLASSLDSLNPPSRARVAGVLNGAARALRGYVAANVVTGLLVGAATWLSLLTLGVPFATALAVWAGFLSFVPLLGRLLGAVPAIIVAFIHTTSAGVVVVIVLAVFHLAESRLLQPRLMGRNVAVAPLAVVVSVLIGFDLLGVLGVIFAIPTAGVIRVLVFDLWSHRRRARPPAVADDEGGGPGPLTGG